MARPEPTSCKPTDGKLIIEADALSIDEFCAGHRISRQTFYKQKSLGLMPATFNVGTRVLISREAAAAWRREREQASQTASAA